MPSLTVTEKIIWTICPQGFSDDGKSLSFSVFVAPRLTASGPNATLGNTGSSFLDWPAALAKLKFAVAVLGPSGPAVVRTLHDDALKLTSTPRSDVWQSLFNAATPIENYSFTDLSKALLLSYPVAKMSGFFDALYTKVAKQAQDDLPTPSDLMGAGVPVRREPGRLSSRTPKGQASRNDILTTIRQAPSLDALTQTPADMLDLFSFYHKPLLAETHFTGQRPVAAENGTWPGYVAPKLPSESALMRGTDFHRIAAAASNYSALSRLCGLVLDFTMPIDGFADGTVRLALQVNRAGDSLPVTRCTFQATTRTFQAEVATPANFSGRCVNLAHGGVDLVQMDVDGAAHKAIGLANALPTLKATAHSADDFKAPARAEASLPTLRTAGLTLAQSDRAARFKKKAARAATLNTAVDANHTPDDLTAEDLIRGYRADIIDVNHNNGPQSLCRRNVSYAFLTPAHGLGKDGDHDWSGDGKTVTWQAGEEEGTISFAAGSSPDGSVPDVFTLHEALFTWRGWSLSVPEPAQSLRNTPSPTKPNPGKAEIEKAMTGPSDSQVPDGLPLNTHFTVASRSLPALRFGHSYQARVRVSDLTGGALDYRGKSGMETWTPATPFLRYEALEAPAVTLVGDVVTGKDETVDYTRVHTPPEQGEGMLRMALRTYDDPKAPGNRSKVSRNIAPPRVTQRFSEMHGVIDDGKGAPQPHWYQTLAQQDMAFASSDLPLPDFLNPASAIPDKSERRTYAVSEAGFALPYLPDPYAIAVMARMKGIGDQSWQDVSIPLYDNVVDAVSKDWPRSLPILIEGSSDYTSFRLVGRTLQVPMPKACRQVVRLSSVMFRTALDNMALWQLLLKGGGKALQENILKGRHWMFTPWREIELIHATQRPLTQPAFVKPHIERGPNERDALLSLHTPLSGPSTARLDIDAKWNEPDDNYVEVDAKSAPVNRPHEAHVARLPIARLDGFFQDYAIDQQPHTFHDTRYRRVIYRMNALTRFKEFFEPAIRDDEKQQNVASHPERLWIPSSASPPAPSILYAIPTFGWLRDHNATASVSRRAGGIRIYLDRPWLVTGYNEMLAVVLPNAGEAEAGNDAAPNRPLVTQWGRDPIFQSGKVATNSPKPAAFRLAAWKGPITATGTSLPEEEGSDLPPGNFQTDNLLLPVKPGPGSGEPTRCSVAPHVVSYDSERQLWYADVVVNVPAGAYFPFLRLAVARYQPVSIPDAYLSPAVSCDFIQLTPDRIAVVVPLDGLGLRYNVCVYGDQPADTDEPTQARRGRLRIQSQVLDAHEDPVLGWRDLDGVPGAGPKIDYTPAGAAQAVQNAEAALVQSASTANRIAGELAAGGALENPPPSPGSTSPGSSKPGQAMSQLAVRSDLPPVSAAARFNTPNLIGSEIVNMPQAPAGGRRRILITETETYHNSAFGVDRDKGDAERIVYAEAIEV